MSLKGLLKGSWKFVRLYFMRIVSVGLIFGIIGLFYWMGFKGVIGFLLGILIMSMVILTKNPVFMWLVEKMQADAYMQEINKDGSEEESNEKGKTIDAELVR